MKKWKEVLFIIGMLSSVVGVWYLTGLVSWISMWWAVAGIVVLWEIFNKIKTGHTISQQFWAWGAEHLKTAWFVVTGMVASIVLLAYHLMTGVYKRKGKS